MKRSDVVRAILQQKIDKLPTREKGLAFAPTNIALCKYWGKRDVELNLPVTSSLSIALPDKGAMTTVTPQDQDCVILNGETLSAETKFVKRVIEYLDLFRPQQQWHLKIAIEMTIPVAAGLASSACGFASLILALNDLFAWELALQELSILARLGSGSAARSLWNGFVEWQAGVQADGMDSFGQPLAVEWPDLRVGILNICSAEKSLSSREAMLRTVNSSPMYAVWPKKVAQDLTFIKQALKMQAFSLLGGTAESNALTMHATMLSSWPPICYCLPETIAAMQRVWHLRKQGLELFFTQDAGPNLKLLFLAKDEATVQQQFEGVEVVVV